MITSWNPSLLEMYETCPKRAKLERVDKLCPACFKGKLKGYELPKCDTCGKAAPVPEPIARGNLVHAQAEAYITGREPVLHELLAKVAPRVNKLRADYKKRLVRVEVMLAVDSTWNMVEWFSKKAWLRTKLDVLHMRPKAEAEVIDWKTGKQKDDSSYADQLSIYSTALLSTYPLKKAKSRLVFTDTNKDVPGEPLLREGLEEAQRAWTKRSLPLFRDTAFAPTPSPTCRWCPFSRNVGGPCVY